MLKRILLLIILVFLGLFFVLGLSGKYGGRFYVSGRNIFGGHGIFSAFFPADRAVGNTIVKEPAYFSLFTPRTFDKVRLSVKLDHPDVDFMEVGVLADNNLKRYVTKSLYSKILCDLAVSWQLKDFGNHKVLSRTGTFSLDDKAVYYFYDPKLAFLGTNYIGDVKVPALRGDHSFYVYDGKSVSLSFSDLNQNDISYGDPVDIYIYDNLGNVVSSTHFADDVGARSWSYNFAPGLYKVELKANDDIVFDNFVAHDFNPMFINRVRLFSGLDSFSVYTDTNFLRTKTINPASVGELNFSGVKFFIDKTYVQYYFNVKDSGLNLVTGKSADLLLENDGIWSFSNVGAYNPRPKILSSATDLSAVNNIATTFDFANCSGSATVDLDLKYDYRVNHRYWLMFSLPNATTSVDILDMRADFFGRSVWQKLYAQLF